ncbi:methyltransferase domain-containing protein [Lachnobacterium bovis]|uniref:methyltransferase domain-containing protein n=1 Tax=Lachnobacterium bovis TaxID=140626 RepID=UPI00048D045E|nr:methyltransferase domain-containing protein [Lachnobacterium bovis]
MIHNTSKLFLGDILDVGCGSGALTIAVAKNNPEAKVFGVDRWGKEYAAFSKALCEENAEKMDYFFRILYYV